MAAGSYSTQTLLALVPSLQEPALFLRNTGFPSVVNFDTEEIFWDRISDDLRIAPIVAPISEAQVVETTQFSSEFIIPPYVKFKFALKPGDMLRRKAGERLSGTLSPQQRKDAKIMELMNTAESMRARREEFMASEILRTGSLTITGKGYGTRTINFQRAAALSVTLAGANLWSATTSNPLKNLEDWSLLAQQQPGGGPLQNFIMDPAAFGLLKAQLLFRGEEKALSTDYRGNASALNLGPMKGKVNYGGNLGAYDIWVYQDWYTDAAGAQQPYMPANTVIGLGAAGGTRAYGSILDFDNLLAQEVFYKTIRKDDPSIEYLIAQSAPILVPTRVNATFRATVG
ncbi:MAG: major capsid protein [Gemmatimonadaceae bacterium]|nr:major capsid protein [Gemmatimonadaceae bacterium]